MLRLTLTALPAFKELACNLVVGIHTVEEVEAMIRQGANWPTGGVLVVVLPEHVASSAEDEGGSDSESEPAAPTNVTPLLPLLKSLLSSRTGKRDTLIILEGLGVEVGDEHATMTIGCLLNGTFAADGKVKGIGQGIGKDKPKDTGKLHPQVNVVS